MMRFITILAMLLCISVAACSREDKGKPSPVAAVNEGKTAPDFTLKGADGKDVTLSSLRGNVVFLNFWATWCPPCKEEIPSMILLNRKMAGKPFVLVGVNNDPEETLRKLEVSRDVTWRNFADPGNEMARAYRVSSWPAVLVLDRKRVIQYIGVPGSFVDFTVDALLESKPAASDVPPDTRGGAGGSADKPLPSGPPPESR